MVRRRNEPSLIESFADLRADYSAAKQSRFRRRRTGLAPMGSGADYHYRGEGDFLRIVEYARDMDRCDCIVGQTIDRAVENEIQDGFTLSPLTGDSVLDKDLAARWYEYSIDADRCDLAGEKTWWDLEQFVSRAVKVDGDILGLATKSGAAELVESHRLRTPTYKTKNITHGVEMDPTTAKPLRYYLTLEDVGTSPATLKLDKFRAYDARDDEGHKQVFHVKKGKRVTQTRGVSALAPIFDMCGMFEDINFAELLHRQISAAFVIFEERDKDYRQMISEMAAGGMSVPEDQDADGRPRAIEGLGPGQIFPGKIGVKYSLASPNIPNPEFFPHMKLVLTLIGINLGLPLVMVLMDGSETNFSGWRGAVDQARMGFRANQRRLIERWHRPVYNWQLRRWIADDPALRNAAQKSNIAIFDHRWNPPTWPYIQPMQDASADLIRTRNALISQRRRCAERGMEWTDLSTEIVEDNALLIEQAYNKAEELNKKHPELKVTWREIASLPTADGVQIAINPGQTEPNNAAA